MSEVAERLAAIASRISQAAERSRRDAREITLVAVSKRHPVETMREYESAARIMGISIVFGENYVQELRSKCQEFRAPTALHLIGPLQSNKIKDAVRLADVIESVHSLKALEGIAVAARAQGKRQSVFLQVNIGSDPRKSGFSRDDVLRACIAAGSYTDSVCLCGLMTITPYYGVADSARSDFRQMNELRQLLVKNRVNEYFNRQTILLSMGMSSDFEVAIEEGADVVRVGTAIFGER